MRPRHLMTLVLLALLLATASSLLGPEVLAACDRWQPAEKTGRVAKKRVDEASGLVASRAMPGVLWTVNDEAGDGRLFGLNHEGKLLAQIEIPIESKDWEDLALGPCASAAQRHCLYIADIGGNVTTRRSVQIIRLPEPHFDVNAKDRVRATAKRFELASFAYPDDRAHDAEALFVDTSGTLWLLDKKRHETTLYRARFSRGLLPGAKLERVAARDDIELATAADLSPDGKHFLIRNHDHAYEFAVLPRQNIAAAFLAPPHVVDLKKERQGEAIAYSSDGQSFFTLSEGKKEPLYRYDRAKACD